MQNEFDPRPPLLFPFCLMVHMHKKNIGSRKPIKYQLLGIICFVRTLEYKILFFFFFVIMSLLVAEEGHRKQILTPIEERKIAFEELRVKKTHNRAITEKLHGPVQILLIR